jgi:hypothetical protein
MLERRRIVRCILAGAVAAPLAAAGDSVHLKNGESFEGVEAVVSGDQVRIELPIGSLRLPLSKVERIEEVDSTLGEYRARERRLDPAGDAAGWLELALWARANDFDRGAAKAALTAARLEPSLPGLGPVMAGLGYVLEDGAGGEWIPYPESMRRRGFVEDRGEWVTADEKRERAAARAEEEADASSSRTHDQLDKALDILAEAVKQPEQPPSTTTVIVQQPLGFPIGAGFGFFPGFTPGAFVRPSVLHDPGIGSVLPFSLSGTFFTGDARVTRDTRWDQMTRRQPGSFIPATPRFFR